MTTPQAPAAVVVVRPHHFRPNPQTSADNSFQAHLVDRTAGQLAAAAFDEVSSVAESLRAVGVTVLLFDDETHTRPDSVFPNNWFSTHSDGRVALYPMYAVNRRQERRDDVVAALRREYVVEHVVDYSGMEAGATFLEGTGAMVLDHRFSVAYGARSRRLDEPAFRRFCRDFGYRPVVFDSIDQQSRPIYHTNVMMSVATEFAVVGLSTIADIGQRETVLQELTTTGRQVIPLTHGQVREFAGNVIELQGRSGRVLALSRRAFRSLTDSQLAVLEQSCTVLPLHIPTVELAGGSVRCMLGGIHLRPRLGISHTAAARGSVGVARG